MHFLKACIFVTVIVCLIIGGLVAATEVSPDFKAYVRSTLITIKKGYVQTREDFIDTVGYVRCVRLGTYDAIANTCDVTCTENESCIQKEAAIQARSGSLTQSILDSTFKTHEINDDEMTTLASYTVTDDSITLRDLPTQSETSLLAYQEDIPKHTALWAEFTRLIPAHARREISAFLIVSDGSDHTLGVIRRSPSDPSTFQLAIDIEDAYAGDQMRKADLRYVLIHELGHLITLGDDTLQTWPLLQTPGSMTDAVLACAPTWGIEGGCVRSGTFFARYLDTFWADLYPSYIQLIDLPDADATARWYEAHASEFVSTYAATSPSEDIAETFATFVYSDNTKEQHVKVAFFVASPEMTILREQIRSRW